MHFFVKFCGLQHRPHQVLFFLKLIISGKFELQGPTGQNVPTVQAVRYLTYSQIADYNAAWSKGMELVLASSSLLVSASISNLPHNAWTPDVLWLLVDLVPPAHLELNTYDAAVDWDLGLLRLHVANSTDDAFHLELQTTKQGRRSVSGALTHKAQRCSPLPAFSLLHAGTLPASSLCARLTARPPAPSAYQAA